MIEGGEEGWSKRNACRRRGTPRSQDLDLSCAALLRSLEANAYDGETWSQLAHNYMAKARAHLILPPSPFPTSPRSPLASYHPRTLKHSHPRTLPLPRSPLPPLPPPSLSLPSPLPPTPPTVPPFPPSLPQSYPPALPPSHPLHMTYLYPTLLISGRVGGGGAGVCTRCKPERRAGLRCALQANLTIPPHTPKRRRPLSLCALTSVGCSYDGGRVEVG